MNNPEQDVQDRKRAWMLLTTVEHHPKVTAWLSESDIPVSTPARRNRRGLWAAAAALVLAVCAGFTAYAYSRPHYETGVGEQRDILLPDGSRMTLNTNTIVTVHYSKTRRYLQLKRGEALFIVKQDAARPFEVSAGGTLTRALGTEFNVDLRKSRVTVSVLDGAVQVIAPDAKPATTKPAAQAAGGETNEEPPAFATALAKGQAVAFRRQDKRMQEEQADLKRIDAWRTRRLEFSNTPLPQAVEEFNRYAITRIVIGTPELSSVRVSGVFSIGDTEGFLYSLQEALGVQTHEASGETILMKQ